MNAMADAWSSGSCDAVVFLDADLIFTADLISEIAATSSDLVLTPNYLPPAAEALQPFHGHFNAGFIWTTTPAFHDRWREAFQSRRWELSDQVSLSDVAAGFTVFSLGPTANVGFWRSENAHLFDFVRIDDACSCLHVHLFQHPESGRGWLEKMFALHCLRFLKLSLEGRHILLLKEIVTLDDSRWYQKSLDLSGNPLKKSPRLGGSDQEVYRYP
ncbi:MAG TPA: hypothetical protein VGD59_05730 [Acidisarcina sp.]